MRTASLSSRVALVQAATTAIALSLVVLGAWAALSALLMSKTDQGLQSTLAQAAGYVETSATRSANWDWITHEIQEHRPPDTRVEVREASGELRAALGPGPALVALGAECANHGQIRICAKRVGTFLVLAGRDRTDDVSALKHSMVALVAISLFAALLVTLTSRFVAAHAIRPLSELASKVAAVSPGEGDRVDLLTGLAEIDLLSTRFDELVLRFEQALAREKRFSAEASHELRTPLTVARGEIEELRKRLADEGTDRALAALDRLTALVEALLWFARAQGRLDDARMEVVNLADLVRAQLEEALRIRPDAKLSSHLPDEALVRGDEHLLARAAANLMDNALKHGDQTPISVRLVKEADRAVLSIENGGHLPERLGEDIFLPFVRGRTDSNGFGLGLSFARAVARAHGGDVKIVASDRTRTALTLSLPVIAWHDRDELVSR
jgi:signal transduction histidine kinase